MIPTITLHVSGEAEPIVTGLWSADAVEGFLARPAGARLAYLSRSRRELLEITRAHYGAQVHPARVLARL